MAVIGAGRERGGLGHEVFRNLLTHDFMGPVYPVNPLGGHVASVPSYATVLDIPHDVDLAVIAVPAHEVLAVVDQCARKRVQALVVMSAGLHGAGPLGEAAERALVERARSQGMRLIGPSRSGVISTDPAVALHAIASRPSTCCPAGSASSPSRARSASPPSSTPGGSGSASRRSSTSGPRPT